MPTDPVHEIARAVDQLMTQVKHIADHLAPPVINVSPDTAVVTGPHADAPTTRDRCDAPDDTATRDALLVLLSRAARGVLTPDEGLLLRQHVEHLLRDRCAEDAHHHAEQAKAERDGAYRERAQLLAWLATAHPAVLAPAPDVDEPGWQILYLDAPCGQLSWHIAPRDAELFGHVERVPADDPRAQWDEHTTEEKYQRIRAAISTAATHPAASGAPTA
ncbi:hypothetical protein [Streptomyces sp. NPDC052496]|uniref:hypothetical protein n=1 Tax=Streptomyces sp. NPDC052496 TaxID=3154951 RepID=UPI0034258494